jgi:hypothetical protein
MTDAPRKFKPADFWSALLSGYSFIGLNTLAQIALVPLYLQHLGKAEFGLLMIMLSAINLVTFGIHGLTGNVLRVLTEHAAHDGAEGFTRSYSRAKLLFALYSCAAAACIAVLFPLLAAGERGQRFDGETALAIGFAIAQIFLNADLGVTRLALAALQRQTSANLLQIIALAVFAALVLPCLYLEGGIAGVLGALVAGNIVARLYALIYVRRAQLPIRWAGEPGILSHARQEYLGPTGLFYLAYGAIFVVAQSDTFILGALTSATTAADFVLLWRIPEALILVLGRIPEHAQIGFLYLHRAGSSEELRRFCTRVSLGLQLAAAGAAVSYGLFGRWIVGLWVGFDAAPANPWGYALAGGAIFWLAYARLPAAFANMQGPRHIRRLAKLAGIELALKILILSLAYDRLHELSPLLAINALHIVAFHYLYHRFMKSFITADGAAPPIDSARRP